MSDDQAASTPKVSRKSKAEEVVEIVDAPAEETPVVEDIVDAEVVEETVATPTAEPRVVYVQTPAPPKQFGNRAVGSIIAIVATVIFAALLALAYSIIRFFAVGNFSFTFLADGKFYIPVLFFLIAFVLLVLVANRANWWAYIFGSILVAVVVYFGSIGLGLLSEGVIAMTPTEAAALYAAQLTSPFIVVSTLLAREVSLWVGALISRRGRKLKARNVEARQTWERELAEKKAEHERGAV